MSSTNKTYNNVPNPETGEISLRVLDVVEGTAVDGPGLRTSIYFAGCRHFCPGCHNPQSWDFSAGKDMTINEIIKIIIENDFDVTFSGGDPLYQIEGVTELARQVKALGKTIWCYTGFRLEEIEGDPAYCDLLSTIDVLVDGPFDESLRDISLRFRGSSNQRIIYLHKDI